MTESTLINLTTQLIGLPTENEWVEFKENNFAPEEIGKRISALSNMELSNIVRNQEWFDITNFFIVENKVPKLLTKSEVEELFGIKCIIHLVGK